MDSPLLIDLDDEYREDNNERAKRLSSGLKIIYTSLSDASTGKIFWASYKDFSSPHGIHRVLLPKEILRCKMVRREIHFISIHGMNNFRIDHGIFLNGRRLEEWEASYGVVQPYSTNKWRMTVRAAAPEANLIPVHVLSGNVIIETYFYDGDLLFDVTKTRLSYA